MCRANFFCSVANAWNVIPGMVADHGAFKKPLDMHIDIWGWRDADYVQKDKGWSFSQTLWAEGPIPALFCSML